MIGALHHIVLFCKAMEASRRWYEAVGFEYLRGYEGMHWFAFGSAEIMLHPTEESHAGRISLHAGTADVKALFERAQSAGLTPFDHEQPGMVLSVPVRRPWGDVEFELVDPDGYRWAFTQTG